MDIGKAVEAIKAGQLVRRIGWNGKGIHLYLEEMLSHRIKVFRGKRRRYEPVVVMYTAQGKHQPGWVCSQADLLADDWELVQP